MCVMVRGVSLLYISNDLAEVPIFRSGSGHGRKGDVEALADDHVLAAPKYPYRAY